MQQFRPRVQQLTHRIAASRYANRWVVLSLVFVVGGSLGLMRMAANAPAGPGWEEVALLIAIFVAITWSVPAALEQVFVTPLSLDNSEHLQAVIGLRTMVISAITGIGILYGLFFAAQQLANIEIGRENLIAGQYNEALSNLSVPGREHDAVLALGSIANESEDYSWRALVALAGFVRQETPWQEGTSNLTPPGPISGAIQDALRILGHRRLDWNEPSPLDLSETDLRMADFSGGQLRNIDLRGAHLEEAILNAADLRGAILDGANFEQASLAAAQLGGMNLIDVDLTGAILLGTHLEGTDLSRTIGLDQMHVEFACADNRTVWPDGPDGSPLHADASNPVCRP